MKNIQQIVLIMSILQKEKNKRLFELARISSAIHKKIETIKKMSTYESDYANADNFKFSRSIPLLHKNLQTFSRKIVKIIEIESSEVERLKESRDKVLKDIDQLDHKIKIMQHFYDVIKTEKFLANEKLDQAFLDELSSTISFRGQHD